jgi:UDP-N-acetylmuramate dehydrogenase
MIENKIQTNIPLAQFSTFKIGGPAEFFVELETKEEVEQAWAWAKEKNVPITILGGGSNVLISDTGVRGLVIKLHNQKLESNGNEIICGAGVVVKELVEKAFEKNLSGIEWSIGIPGSVGGAIRGNAGAHGGSYDKVIESVLAFDSVTHEWETFQNKDCGFEYRSSRFKIEPHYIIWELVLRLQATEDKSATQKALDEYKKIPS